MIHTIDLTCRICRQVNSISIAEIKNLTSNSRGERLQYARHGRLSSVVDQLCPSEVVEWSRIKPLPRRHSDVRSQHYNWTTTRPPRVKVYWGGGDVVLTIMVFNRRRYRLAAAATV